MNYLAHTYLSCGDEHLLIGNFITDFISAKKARSLDMKFQNGVALHRKIDSFTDSHPMFIQGRKRLAKFHGKYAPVVLDILYDYLLARQWDSYSGQSLEAHAKDCYVVFEKYARVFEENGVMSIPKMISHNFLEAYQFRDRVEYVLGRMDHRTSFDSQFINALKHLEEALEKYESEFNIFFPEVIEMVEANCVC